MDPYTISKLLLEGGCVTICEIFCLCSHICACFFCMLLVYCTVCCQVFDYEISINFSKCYQVFRLFPFTVLLCIVLRMFMEFFYVVWLCYGYMMLVYGEVGFY